MFNFTTTHVINSNYDFSTNKALWSLGKDENGKATLHIKGVNNFKSSNVEKVYKAPYTDPKMAQVEIDFSELAGMTPALKKNDTIRLSIYIRLTEADQSSYYANDTRYKGRPFTIEFPWLGSAADTLKNVLKLIRKYGLLVFEKEVVKTSTKGTKLVLTAVNEFQRFHTVKLEKFLDPKELYVKEWEEITEDGLVTVVEKGVEGFGTYGWVLRNIKLPTHQHTTAFAPKQDEMPVPGAHYNQYTIHYCVNRGPLGLNAVGDTVKSVTTSVFYVNTALLGSDIDMSDEVVGTDKDGGDITVGSANFETALKKLADDAGTGVWETVPKTEDTKPGQGAGGGTVGTGGNDSQG